MEPVVFNVKVQTAQGVQERKAIDLFSLKEFLEEAKTQYSVFNLPFDKLNEDALIWPYIGRAAMAAILELEELVDKGLGLIPEAEPQAPPQQEPRREVDEPEAVQPPQQQVRQSPRPPQQMPPDELPQMPRRSQPSQRPPVEEPEYVDEGDDRIVL